MKKTEIIDTKIRELEALIARCRDRLSEHKNSESELKAQVGALRSRAIRDADQEASSELDALRVVLDFAATESADLTAEISKAATEIEELKKLRVVAEREEVWDVFAAESKIAIAEAAEIEKHLSAFAKAIGPHKDRLAKLSMLARRAEVNRQIDGRHLFRRIAATMHQLSPFENSRQHKAYSEPYQAILQNLVAATGRMREPEAESAAVAVINQ